MYKGGLRHAIDDLFHEGSLGDGSLPCPWQVRAFSPYEGNSSAAYLESCIVRADGGAGLYVAPNRTNASTSKLFDTKLHLDSWDEPSVFLNLILFVLFKFVLTAMSITMAIPCGVFTPVFAIGAGVGRFFGELTVIMGGSSIIAGGYAVVGAAAFTAGVTGTVSIAVIIFELTSQLNYMLPVSPGSRTPREPSPGTAAGNHRPSIFDSTHAAAVPRAAASSSSPPPRVL